MKNIILTIALITVIPFAAAEASAQCDAQLRAEIPFDFILNDKEIKAGIYTFTKMDCNTANPLVVLRDTAGRFLGFVNRSATPIAPPQPNEPASLTFTRYGVSYFLSEVRAPSARFSFRIHPGNNEVLLARLSERKKSTVPLERGPRK